MNDADIERLYDQIIMQDKYPGGSCPTGRSFVRYVKGSLSDEEQQNMREHLSSCPPCARMVEDLELARRWFREHERSMASQVAERAAQIGLPAGQECPPVEALEKYCTSAVPDTEAGRRFRRRVKEHLAACAVCQRTVDSWGKRLDRVVTIALDELRGGLVQALVDKVRELLLGIQAAAAVRGAGGYVYAAAGYRAGALASVNAIVLDRQRWITLSDEGQPVQVAFDLIQARIERDGHFVLDLCTADRRYWESTSGRFVVSATLLGENTKLVLPAEHIRPDGRVTIVGHIPSGVEIEALPVSALSLAILEDAETPQA